MSGIYDRFRKAWQVPDELRDGVHGDVLDVLAGRHETSVRGRVTREKYEVAWDGHGRLFVRWGAPLGAPGHWLMLEGRTQWESLARQLELMEASSRETHRLVLEVDVTPQIEFEFDDDDLEVMAHALAQVYGHMIRVKLSRQGEAGEG